MSSDVNELATQRVEYYSKEKIEKKVLSVTETYDPCLIVPMPSDVVNILTFLKRIKGEI